MVEMVMKQIIPQFSFFKVLVFFFLVISAVRETTEPIEINANDPDPSIHVIIKISTNSIHYAA